MIEILNRWTRAQVFRSDAETLRAADLIRANLTEADLRAADLSGANLSGANLIRANLTDADLRAADLSGANLSGANLRAADLSGANLRAADLIRANLTDADLRAADLRAAKLSWANLRAADLSAAECLTARGDFLRLAGTMHPIIAIDESNVSVGCMRNTLAWWMKHYATVGRKEQYTDAQIEEYRLHLEYVGTWLRNLAASKKAEASR